jgi:5-(carboxyamino)imidazole ribonucleotide synthase
MSRPLPQGATIGILGSGQLGRMMALAAAPMGYRTHIYAPEAGPAGRVASAQTLGEWDDEAALRAFAAAVDVVTLEFENVPVATLDVLTRAGVPVRPGARVLATCQDRVAEKTFLRDLGVPTAPFEAVHDADQLAAAAARLGRCIVKTARAGYDGRGQAKLESPADAAMAWASIGRPQAAIVEGFVPFSAECSVLIARGADGETRAFEVVHNVHRDHILHTTTAPMSDPAVDTVAAEAIATEIAQALDLVGLLAVELFRVEGPTDLRVNELAPRPHNSGHWTIEGAATSQFAQAIRAAAGLPLGDPRRIVSRAEMTNLLGDAIDVTPSLWGTPDVYVHRYDKGAARPGRKMGHITRLWR